MARLRSDYAETLLTIATMPAGAVPQAATAMVRRNGLESRIEAILSGRGLGAVGRRQRVALEMVAGVVGLVLAIAQPVAGGSSTAPSPTPRAAGAESNSWIGRALSVEPVAARFENDDASIVRVLGAKVRVVDRVGSGIVGVTMPEVVLENRDRTNTVASVRIAFDLPTTRDRLEQEIRIAPGGIATLSLEPEKWSAVVRRKESARLLVHVAGYAFTNGVRRGAVETPAPPAQPEAWTKSGVVAPTPSPFDDADAPSPDWSGPSIAAKFRNLADAPVVIVEARTPQSPAIGDRKGTTWLPQVKIENRSSREVVALRLRFKAEPEGHGVSGDQVTIARRSSSWASGSATAPCSDRWDPASTPAGRGSRNRPAPSTDVGYFRENFTGIATHTATGLPFAFAGLNRHWRTAATAASSNMGKSDMSDLTTLVSPTVPSLSTSACTTTVPIGKPEATSGHTGATLVIASGSSSTKTYSPNLGWSGSVATFSESSGMHSLQSPAATRLQVSVDVDRSLPSGDMWTRG